MGRASLPSTPTYACMRRHANGPSPYLEQKSPLSNVCQDLSNLDRVTITP